MRKKMAMRQRKRPCVLKYAALMLLVGGAVLADGGNISPNSIVIDGDLASTVFSATVPPKGINDWVKDSLANTDAASLAGGIATGIDPTGADTGGIPTGHSTKLGHWNGLRIVDGVSKSGAPDADTFLSGGKENDTSTWKIGPGNAGGGKSDASEAYIANNGSYLYCGMERIANNGSTAFDFEFNKLVPDPADPTNENPHYVPRRSVGDVLLTFEMISSSKTFAVHVFKFDGFTYVEIPNPTVVFPDIQGAMNLVDKPAGPWGYVTSTGTWATGNIPKLEFGEARVPLLALAPPGQTVFDTCSSAYVQVRTRSSAVDSSDLKDATRIVGYAFGGPTSVPSINLSGCEGKFVYDGMASYPEGGQPGDPGLEYTWDIYLDNPSVLITSGEDLVELGHYRSTLPASTAQLSFPPGVKSVGVRCELKVKQTSNGCVNQLPASKSGTVIVGFSLGATPTPASCDNSSDGSITVTFSDGQGPYKVGLDGATPTTATSGKVFSNLSPGVHKVKVVDSSPCTQEIDVTVGALDVEAPKITCPADVELPCGSSTDPNSTGKATATDDHDSSITITYTDTPTDANCTGKPGIQRTWKATDDCGHFSTCDQYITFVDTTPPSAPADPATAEVQCPSDVPLKVDKTATDDCGQSITVSPVDGDPVPDAGGCGYTITRTWTFTDSCGNTSVTTQKIHVKDTTAPVAPPNPTAFEGQCVADVPPPVDKTATDNCDGAITVSPVDSDPVQDTAGCGFTITRTWKFTDRCGNTSSTVQQIHIKDTTAPVAPADPADVEGQCVGDIPTPVDMSALDNCSGLLTVSPVDSDPVTDTKGCGYTITRKWTFVDLCGNSSTTTLRIHIKDTTAPTISDVPGPTTLECGATPVFAEPTASDNCSVESFTHEDQTTQGQNGSYTVVRTWTAKDPCGNTTTTSQSITVKAQPLKATLTKTTGINDVGPYAIVTASPIDPLATSVVWEVADHSTALGVVNNPLNWVTVPGATGATLEMPLSFFRLYDTTPEVTMGVRVPGEPGITYTRWRWSLDVRVTTNIVGCSVTSDPVTVIYEVYVDPTGKGKGKSSIK